jgi:hypothetical protein
MHLRCGGPGLLQGSLALGFGRRRLHGGFRGVAKSCTGLLQSGARGTGPMRARAPDATGTAVARHGDNYELGVVNREVDGSLPASVHDHSPR